ncbi:hypothetical protein CCR75_009344 [Bremia lactucae]|uniref:Uncharacterized protein n=1 Tax=Bremia lactucae TaxID=4779 RepID=A0A976FRJ6_BRELC|nr:hypothetical protein CCR75_009344 [Bremia lactucae]
MREGRLQTWRGNELQKSHPQRKKIAAKQDLGSGYTSVSRKESPKAKLTRETSKPTKDGSASAIHAQSNKTSGKKVAASRKAKHF